MRLIPTRSCVPGMKLGKCIFNEEGIILLKEHAQLSQTLINRLQQLGIDFLYIEDEATADVVIEEPISAETRIKALSEIRNHFKMVVESSGKAKFSKSQFMGKAFGNVMKMIMDDLDSRESPLIMLLNMNVLNNYLYQHSLNVCIYATMLGMAYGYGRDELATIGLGGLLHDIGKTKINPDIIKKAGPLSAEEKAEVQKHAEFGFKLLKDEPNIPLLAAHCAFQHHERLDGSGYPRGIKDNEIHEYAKWIAIVDSYDSMTTHRPHRLAMLPHQAMEVLFAGVGTLYEHKKVALFRDNVAIYPLGLTVTLSTGEKGVVVRINPAVPQRPTVRVLEEADGRKLTQLYEIDLSEKLTVFVSKVDEWGTS
ncbi:HD-GYP domain-containing protein [Paenibacillus doosanensis]|uniref:HD-GYP domain-containing protein n=1 Tax=Paenibacillus doosanensis TaxID=1229154 RepID=UPI00217FF7CA|nr:HD-GYP domain-containing protein [Paenibacillus doosanensis]MCS7464637.1 HD-GYP domain-containing protein [Paenibacillus doosanensis]